MEQEMKTPVTEADAQVDTVAEAVETAEAAAAVNETAEAAESAAAETAEAAAAETTEAAAPEPAAAASETAEDSPETEKAAAPEKSEEPVESMADYEAEIDASLRRYERGEKVKCTVVSVDMDKIMVELGSTTGLSICRRISRPGMRWRQRSSVRMTATEMLFCP